MLTTRGFIHHHARNHPLYYTTKDGVLTKAGMCLTGPNGQECHVTEESFRKGGLQQFHAKNSSNPLITSCFFSRKSYLMDLIQRTNDYIIMLQDCIDEDKKRIRKKRRVIKQAHTEIERYHQEVESLG